jgi:hypothetical protein
VGGEFEVSSMEICDFNLIGLAFCNMTCLFVYSSSFLVFVVSVTHVTTVGVSYCLEYILYLTGSLLGLSPYTVSSAKYELRLIHNAMPFPCRAHAVPLPYRAAKGLDCVFPI